MNSKLKQSPTPPGREEQPIILQISFEREKYEALTHSLHLMIGRWFENIAGIEESNFHESCGMQMSHKTNDDFILNVMIITNNWMDLEDLWHKFTERFSDRFDGSKIGTIKFDMRWLAPRGVSRKIHVPKEEDHGSD